MPAFGLPQQKPYQGLNQPPQPPPPQIGPPAGSSWGAASPMGAMGQALQRGPLEPPMAPGGPAFGPKPPGSPAWGMAPAPSPGGGSGWEAAASIQPMDPAAGAAKGSIQPMGAAPPPPPMGMGHGNFGPPPPTAPAPPMAPPPTSAIGQKGMTPMDYQAPPPTPGGGSSFGPAAGGNFGDMMDKMRSTMGGAPPAGGIGPAGGSNMERAMADSQNKMAMQQKLGAMGGGPPPAPAPMENYGPPSRFMPRRGRY